MADDGRRASSRGQPPPRDPRGARAKAERREVRPRGPRSLVLRRCENGFGFTLRHFIVYPPESHSVLQDDHQLGLHQGDQGPALDEPMDTIFVKNVREDSPAHSAGLATGDRIIAVNGQTITGHTYAQVVQLIQQSGSYLHLLVVPKEDDILQRYFGETAHNPETNQRPSRLRSPENFDHRGSATMQEQTSVLPAPHHHHHHHHHHHPHHHHHNHHLASQQHTHWPQQELLYQERAASHLGRRTSEPSRRDGREDYYSGNGVLWQDSVVSTNNPRQMVSAEALHYGPIGAHYSNSRFNLESGRRVSSSSLPSASSIHDSSNSLSSADSASTLTGGQDGCSSDDSIIISRIKKSFEQKEEFLRRPNQPISWNIPVPTSEHHMSSVPTQAVIAREFYARPQKFQKPVWPPSSPATSAAPAAVTNVTYHQQSPPRSAQSVIKSPNFNSRPTHQSVRRVQSDIESERDAAPLSGDQKKFSRGQFVCGGPVTNIPNAPTTTTNHQQDSAANRLGVATSQSGARHAAGKTTFTTTLSRIHENIPAVDSVVENSSSLYTAPGYSDNLDNLMDNARASSLPPSLSASNDVQSCDPLSQSPHEDIALNGRYTAHPKLHLVSRRARQFETGQLEDDDEGPVLSDRTLLYRSELSRLSAKKNVPNVAVRKQEFESRSGSESKAGRRPNRESRSLESAGKLASGEDSWSGNRMIPIGSKYLHCIPPKDFQQETTEPPVAHDDLSAPVKLRARSNSAESWAAAVASRGHGRSALDWPPHRAQPVIEEPQRHKAVRQDSYLAAVRTPVTSERSSRSLKRQAAVPMEEQEESEEPPSPTAPAPAGPVVRPSHLSIPHPVCPASPPHTPDIALREEGSESDVAAGSDAPTADEDRLVRRVSYLKATWGDRMHVDSDLDGSDTETPYIQARSNTAPHSSLGQTLQPDSNKENLQLLREGWLHCKITVIDGKRAGDRSWKQVWAVLRGPILYLYKDKKDPQTPLNTLENDSLQSIGVRHSQVDIAGDYTKKKHVLRLNTIGCSELLLQAEDAGDMAQWIRVLQEQAGAPLPEEFSSRHLQSIGGSTSRLSPLPAHKGIRKLTSFRNRSPTGQSPVNKTRKPSQSDQLPSPKNKTWKGRVAKQFRRIQHGAGSPSSPTAPYPEGATIGIPLEDCTMSTENEYVPLLVHMCTQIVEERGLDIIGIYRVPGNTAAVSSLTEGVNKGIECLNLQQDPRWSDVNVISSLLKLFFRRLPDSLLTTELYPHFIEADKIEDASRRISTIRKLIHELPDHHFETLKYLLFHLKKVVDHSEKNKMEARNLAIVFGPTLVRAGDDNMVTMVTDMSHQCRIVESLILYVDWFFCEDESENSFPFNMLQENAELESATNNQNLLLSNIQKVEGMKADSPSRDISAKDIVSSIISAANRKMHKAKTKKVCGPGVGGGSVQGTGAVEDEQEICGESVHDERDSGQLRKSIADDVEEQLQSLSSTLAEAVANNVSAEREAEEQRKYIEDQEKADRPLEKGITGGSDEVTIRTYAGLSATTQERIRRFERETKAMLQRDLTRQRRDMEKREAEKHKIELELQQARKDLENEDLLDAIADNPSGITKTVPSAFDRKSPDGKQNSSPLSRRLSSSSLSTAPLDKPGVLMTKPPAHSASNEQTFAQVPGMREKESSPRSWHSQNFTQTKKLGVTHFYPESPNTTGSRNSLPDTGVLQIPVAHAQPAGRSSDRGSSSSVRSRSSVCTSRASLPVESSLKPPEPRVLQRSSSSEDLQQASPLEEKGSINGTMKRLKTCNEQPHPVTPQRCGSLDSLQEAVNTEGRDRPQSDVSDDGSDLLASLTSTFDRKLKSLLKPVTSLSEATTLPPASKKTCQASECVADGVPAASPQTQLQNQVVAAVYRDPSLHRGHSSNPTEDAMKSENPKPKKLEPSRGDKCKEKTKEGCCAAQRQQGVLNSNRTETEQVDDVGNESRACKLEADCDCKGKHVKASENCEASPETKFGQLEVLNKLDKEKTASSTKLKRSESLNKPDNLEAASNTRLRRSSSLNKAERSESPSNTKLKRSDSLTKNEKTESNISKRRQQELVATLCGRNSSFRVNNKENENITIMLTKLKRKNGMPERSIKRRHTVGGTKDFDKVNWLDNRLQHELEETRAATVDCTQVNKERPCLRTSSPDLSSSRLSRDAEESYSRPHSSPDTNLASKAFKVPLESHV